MRSHQVGFDRPRGKELQVARRLFETGLASLGDYRLAFGHAPETVLKDLCGRMVLLLEMPAVEHQWVYEKELGVSLPDETLPAEDQENLDMVEQVAHASGLQVLAGREANNEWSHLWFPDARASTVNFYLAVGPSAQHLRQMLWERRDGN